MDLQIYISIWTRFLIQYRLFGENEVLKLISWCKLCVLISPHFWLFRERVYSLLIFAVWIFICLQCRKYYTDLLNAGIIKVWIIDCRHIQSTQFFFQYGLDFGLGIRKVSLRSQTIRCDRFSIIKSGCLQFRWWRADIPSSKSIAELNLYK